MGVLGRVSMGLSLRLLLVTAIMVLALPMSCRGQPPDSSSQRLRGDTQWMQDLSRLLDLCYVERGDFAAFTGATRDVLGGSLHTTYAVVRLLRSVGVAIPNQANVSDWVASQRDARGVYVDPFSVGHFAPPNETREALEVLEVLGAVPKDVDVTARYLLSLEYNDGTFLLDAEKGPSRLEETALGRIGLGTSYVVDALLAAGLRDSIPQETKSILASEIARGLQADVSSESAGHDELEIIPAVRALTRIDPGLVSDRAKDFVANELRTITSSPPDGPYLFASLANDLMDVSDLLGLPDAHDPQVIETIKSYLLDKVLPRQNRTGGFGPSDTIDPMATSEIVILANRLGVAFPNLNKLLSEIGKHWLGFGWAAFTIEQLDSDNIRVSYYAAEIARFAGYEYDKSKVTNFLTGFLSEADSAGNVGDSSIQVAPLSGSSSWALRDLYYVLKGLETVNGRLTDKEKHSAEDVCKELVKGVAMESGFWYVLPISREAGFSLDEATLSRVNELAHNYNETKVAAQEFPPIQILDYLWLSSGPEGSVISRDEIRQYLSKAYDEKTASYVSPAVDGISIEQGVPAGTPRPDIFETYYAIKLLSEIGDNPADRSKTLDFVFASMQKYGFGREPTWPYDPSIQNTFAALMILEELSE